MEKRDVSARLNVVQERISTTNTKRRTWRDIEFINHPLMASQKVRPTALRLFFRTSTYLTYAFAPEKPPSLVGRNFCLATHLLSFANASFFV
jgi:hypothetical protein